MDADMEFDENFDDEEMEVEEEAPKKRNPLRIVLLVLVLLLLLCAVCYLGSQFIGNSVMSQVESIIPGMGAATVPESVPVVPATEEPAAEPTEEAVAPTEPTQEPTTDEQPATTEPPAGTEPTEEAQAPADGAPIEATEESGETVPTTEPVPGPTSTPAPEGAPETDQPQAGPTVAITPVNCDNNLPPIAEANGPYDGMMGKGQAFVTFDAIGSEDPDGTIIRYEWDFGDQSGTAEGPMVTHGYQNVGNYVAILTVTDNCNTTGQDITEVTIGGPTPEPPGPETPMPTTEPTTEPPVGEMNLGFCYIVQYGDTLSGIAWYYGVPLQDLAYVNNVNPEYFVRAGEGLFIPMMPPTNGANGYQVQYGDTIHSIAYQCAVSPSAVAEANGVPVDTVLTPGEFVIIPIGRY